MAAKNAEDAQRHDLGRSIGAARTVVKHGAVWSIMGDRVVPWECRVDLQPRGKGAHGEGR